MSSEISSSVAILNILMRIWPLTRINFQLSCNCSLRLFGIMIGLYRNLRTTLYNSALWIQSLPTTRYVAGYSSGACALCQEGILEESKVFKKPCCGQYFHQSAPKCIGETTVIQWLERSKKCDYQCSSQACIGNRRYRDCRSEKKDTIMSLDTRTQSMLTLIICRIRALRYISITYIDCNNTPVIKYYC